MKDLILNLFAFGCCVVMFWLLSIRERLTREALALADQMAGERDSLAHWLNVVGWQVDYQGEKVSIWRDGDPEEELLAR